MAKAEPIAPPRDVQQRPERVSREAPQPGSGAMFDRIAARYDLLNRLLSLGVDRRWRRRAVAALALPDQAQVLDLATGTGDIALEIVRQHPDAHVVGLDPSPGMLRVAARKTVRQRDPGTIRLLVGGAERLPFPDRSFDAVAIAFGIRNVPDRSAALREMARVTRDQGRVAILELTEPRGWLIGWAARLWIHSICPRLGAWLSGAGEYRYLERSIAAFPSAEEFDRQLIAAGLIPVAIRPLCFGVATLFVTQPRGDRPEASHS